jgi:hypothetical protein
MNAIPSLDRMKEADLMAFWSRYHRASRKDAEALIGDSRKGYLGLAADLANYACNRATAMQCRRWKDPKAAEIYEIVCKQIYMRLPIDLRW